MYDKQRTRRSALGMATQAARDAARRGVDMLSLDRDHGQSLGAAERLDQHHYAVGCRR